MRARRHIGILIKQDLRYTLSSARGLLFLVFFTLLWVAVLWKLAGGLGSRLATPQGSFFLTWLFDSNIAQMLQDRPPTLAAYFVIAATLTPVVAILASCDQTASDIGTRHIRFLIPRVGRAEIFGARLVSAAILITVAQLAAGIAATIIALVVDGAGGIGTGAIVSYGAGVTARLILYSMPIVALMSLLSAGMGSIGLALLVGLGAYALSLVVALMPLEGKVATIASFIFPNGLKPYLLQSETGPVLGACAGALAYIALFTFFGWQVFRRRDA